MCCVFNASESLGDIVRQVAEDRVIRIPVALGGLEQSFESRSNRCCDMSSLNRARKPQLGQGSDLRALAIQHPHRFGNASFVQVCVLGAHGDRGVPEHFLYGLLIGA
jgi:hypothetical protein